MSTIVIIDSEDKFDPYKAHAHADIVAVPTKLGFKILKGHADNGCEICREGFYAMLEERTVDTISAGPFKCVVACLGGDGPSFHPVVVTCTPRQRGEGDHYNAAQDDATDAGFDAPMVVFDEDDGPDWLFARFDWASASKTEV